MEASKRSSPKRISPWEKLFATVRAPCMKDCPKITVVIPTYNCSHSITMTLDSILEQNCSNWEGIVIDANSTDRTRDIIKGYVGDKIRLYSVTNYHIYEMCNRGISLASGTYINFLFPGDFYLSSDALSFIGATALEARNPALLYAGCVLRDGVRDPRILFRPFTLDLLKRGQQPTSLQSCWWRADILIELGKFDHHFALRGGLDLMCRFLLKGGFRVQSTSRVLTDYDRHGLTHRAIMRHFLETLPIIYKYFGFWTTVRWWLRQKDFSRSTKLWLRSVRTAFVGR